MNQQPPADIFQPSPEFKRLLAPLVGVCVPAAPFMYSRTAFCLQTMTIVAAQAGARQVPAMIMGDDAARARNTLVDTVLKHGVEWVLLIDSDMEFPPHGLMRLLSHDLDIVGADYRMRGAPYTKLGKFDPETMPQADTGLVERHYLGLGFLLLRASVFKTLKKPWFSRLYDSDENMTMMTEDLVFFHAAKQAGLRCWCDMDLTREVKHIGDLPVPWDLPP